jgi:hypothetical protein
VEVIDFIAFMKGLPEREDLLYVFRTIDEFGYFAYG